MNHFFCSEVFDDDPKPLNAPVAGELENPNAAGVLELPNPPKGDGVLEALLDGCAPNEGAEVGCVAEELLDGCAPKGDAVLVDVPDEMLDGCAPKANDEVGAVGADVAPKLKEKDGFDWPTPEPVPAAVPEVDGVKLALPKVDDGLGAVEDEAGAPNGDEEKPVLPNAKLGFAASAGVAEVPAALPNAELAAFPNADPAVGGKPAGVALPRLNADLVADESGAPKPNDGLELVNASEVPKGFGVKELFPGPNAEGVLDDAAG